MFKSMMLNFLTDWLAKSAAAGFTAAATNGLINHDQQVLLVNAIGAAIALAITAGHKVATSIAARNAVSALPKV